MKCKCGCGQEIIKQKHHKYYGVPKYIQGHTPFLNSVEALKKRSERMKKNNPMKNPIFVEKSASKNRGGKRTEEQIRNISIGTKKAMNKEEVKNKLRKPKTENHKKNVSIGVANLWKKKEYRDKNTGKNSFLYKNGVYLEKHYCIDCTKELKNVYAKRCSRCSNKEVRNRPEIRAAHSVVMKKIQSERWQNGIFDGVFKSPTKPEKEIMQVLKELNLPFIFQFRPENYSRPYDFFIPSLKLLIEFDGVYWHSLPEVIKRDIQKTEYAQENRYALLRFSESNLSDVKNIIFIFR